MQWMWNSKCSFQKCVANILKGGHSIFTLSHLRCWSFDWVTDILKFLHITISVAKRNKTSFPLCATHHRHGSLNIDVVSCSLVSTLLPHIHVWPHPHPNYCSVDHFLQFKILFFPVQLTFELFFLCSVFSPETVCLPHCPSLSLLHFYICGSCCVIMSYV